jgi:hypothetical protein
MTDANEMSNFEELEDVKKCQVELNKITEQTKIIAESPAVQKTMFEYVDSSF